MKNLLLIFAVVVLFAVPVKAQTWTPSKVELFGGPAFAFDSSPVSTTFGGNVDMAFFPFMGSSNTLVQKVGLAADVAYTTASYGKTGSESLMTGMVGPRFRLQLGSSGWQVFAQGLLGASREGLATPGGAPRRTYTGGAFLFGGGLDAQFSRHFAIRFFELGYEQTFAQRQAHTRVSAGVKYNF
jgi:hypothetical protein